MAFCEVSYLTSRNLIFLKPFLCYVELVPYDMLTWDVHVHWMGLGDLGFRHVCANWHQKQRDRTKLPTGIRARIRRQSKEE